MIVDWFTDYRSRYGYPTRHALVAEVWWRLEHAPIIRRLGTPYRKRKAAERRGFDAAHR